MNMQQKTEREAARKVIFDKVKAEHPGEELYFVATAQEEDGPEEVFIYKRANRLEYQGMAIGLERGGVDRMNAEDQLTVDCTVYPPREQLVALMGKYPVLGRRISDAIYAASAGGRVIAQGKV
jgi:hypothetical protein